MGCYLDRSPRPKNDNYSPAIPKRISTGGFPGLDIKSKSKLKNTVPPDYHNRMRSQIDLIFEKRAFLALAIVGGLGLTIFFILTTPYLVSIGNKFPSSRHMSNNITSPYTQPSYVDFPALMSIESSLGRIVGSATAGSALARLLKQGEMSVSDLSTIIKHSDLSCRRTLGEQLDRFSNDAKEGVVALQLFESRVGEGLDQ